MQFIIRMPHSKKNLKVGNYAVYVPRPASSMLPCKGPHLLSTNLHLSDLVRGDKLDFMLSS